MTQREHRDTTHESATEPESATTAESAVTPETASGAEQRKRRSGLRRVGKLAAPVTRYSQALRNESFAGLVLVISAVVALIWANSPGRDTYFALAATKIGPESLGLHLDLAHWAADFVLALFFFVVGMELKQEFTIGSLNDPRKAALPVLAAVTGMLGPIGVYCATQAISGARIYDGWAIPVATDIAFALGVLALVGKGLPKAAGIFLMTLAVADDLGGIIVIAIFFSEGVNFLFLGGGLLVAAVFGLLCWKGWNRWWLLWPLALVCWYCFFRAGVHATISAVVLGFMIPTSTTDADDTPLTERYSERLIFWSAGIALPIFAFFAAGVNITDAGGITALLADPVAIGIYLGLPLGKCIGIFCGTWLFVKVFRLKLGEGLHLGDIFPMSILAGIGFTVSLLIAQLSFAPTDPHEAHARVGVLLGTLLSVILGALATRIRVRHHRASGTLHDDAARGSADSAA